MDGIEEKQLILFPYANNLEYKDQTLSFNIQFLDEEKTVDIAITVGLDDDLSDKIEELLERV